MSFKERNAAVTLIVLVVVYGGYAAWLSQGPHSAGQTLLAYLAVALVSVGLAIVLAISFAVYAALRGERDEESDERDRRIGQMSSRNGYWVLLCGLWAVPLLALFGTRVLAANAALLLLALAEGVNYASRLYYYRRGV